MLIAVIGESCAGKTTFTELLRQNLDAEVYTGKDYLRLAKNEAIAKKLFEKRLAEAVMGSDLLYVISEREHLSLLPEGAVKVLMTADLDLILERFAVRMRGNLPLPVRQMLERKHGCFDSEPCHYHIHNSEETQKVIEDILCRKNWKP